MAYYSQNGTGIDSNAYIYVQLQVTRTDYDTYSHFDLKSVAVSDTGTSSFIRGQVTTNQAGTSWTTATDWKSVSYNGTTTLATSSFNINRGSSDKTVRCGAYAEGGGTGIYSGDTDYAWLNVTVPKVESPNAPSNCSASYVSDSSASVSWANGSITTAKPRTATLVERQTDGGSWVQVATLGSSVTNWTDNGISANHSYLYRVRAQNSIGYSAYSTAPSMIFTTPAAPSEVILDKTAATTVQVDVTGTWGYSVTYDIESTYDGGSTWASVATSTSFPYSATVNAGTVQFRVRAVRGSLSSAWTLSASLVTICPPLAPTITQQPANPTVAGSGAVVAWTPNHPDGTSQMAAQVKFDGTTHDIGADTFSYSQTVQVGTHTVQVRTKGLDASWGEWSNTISFNAYNPPSVVIDSPSVDGETVIALPLYIEWSVTDTTGVSAQRVIIEGPNGTLYNQTQNANARSVALTDSDMPFQNGTAYTLRVRVMGGSGLVSEAVRTFNIEWASPAAPKVEISEGEGASSQIIATAGEEGAAQNLAPFFSMPLTGSYWGSVSDGITRLGDGWARFDVSQGAVFNAVNIPSELQPSTQYTVLAEFRNVSGTATVSIGDWAIQIDGTDVLVRDGQFSTSGSNAVINATYGTNGTDIQFAEKDVFASAVSTDIGGNAYLLGTTISDLSQASVFVGGTVSGEASFDMRLSIYEGEYAGSFAPYNAPTTQSITVQRVNPDGTLWTVAADLQSGATCIDPLPPLGVDYTYRAVASAVSGATSSTEVSNRLGGCRWALNFGQAASACKLVGRNPSSSVSYEHGGELYHFARGFQNPEDMLPEFYPVGSIDASGTLEFDAETRGEANEIMALMFQYPVVWLRTPFGERRRVRVKPSYNLDRRTKRITVSYDLIRFGEAW